MKCCQLAVHKQCISCSTFVFKLSSMNRLDLFGDGFIGLPKKYAVEDSQQIKVASWFLAALTFAAFLYYMKYMSSIDKFTITPSDFCILIENLPRGKFKLQ